MVNALKLIKKYYNKDSVNYKILIKHAKQVTLKALEIASRVPELHPDIEFIKNGCMLHDIGIFMIHAPEIGCFGNEPYIKHGVLGKELLEKEGLNTLALVCERHTGVGITKEEIIKNKLPLPKRDLAPLSIEEEIISFADLFFSKNPKSINHEFTLQEIIERQKKHGKEKIAKLNEWIKKFKY
ncbi:MAG: HDIG domain-containing metalloprotein [Candidatus Nanoarchaeia archaeon]|jgi:uncharacterized protein